jgi:hypothetical protein
MWPDFVMPFWDMFFKGPVPGRVIHCEDMKPEQLHWLDELQVTDYDPGVSPVLIPARIAENTQVPFGWRLAGIHYGGMECADVRDFVYRAAADGASYAFTFVSSEICNPAGAAKLRAFIEAAEQTKQMLARGATRAEVGGLVSGESGGAWPASRSIRWSAA